MKEDIMAFLDIRNADWPLNPAGDQVIAGEGAVFNCGQLSDKGYDFQRETGSVYTGNLEGSVAGEQWTTIVSLAADAQGVIPAQYNFVRIKTSAGGAYNGDAMKIAGKAI